DTWQQYTDDYPYFFWLDNAKRLQSQLWNDTSTRTELSSSVIKVKAIRAWKNVNFEEFDQGIVVGYIKADNKVYYRNLGLESDGSLVWEHERKIEQFAGLAVNLNLFITNDFRMGFA